MTNEKVGIFLALSKDEKVDFLIPLENQEREQYLKKLKTTNKAEYFSVSALTKSRKLNPIDKNKYDGTYNDSIDIINISPNPLQPRLELDKKKFDELVDSIKKDGLLQPIVVNQSEENVFELIAGSSRLKACEILGMTKIKANIFSNLSTTDENYSKIMLSNALLENIQRNNLDNLELALSFSNALKEGIYKNNSDLAKAMGKEKMYITKILSILKLTDEVFEHLRKHKAIKDLSALYYLQKIEDKAVQKEKYFELFNKSITREELIGFIRENQQKKSLSLYEFKSTNNKITFNANISRLPKEKKELLKKELEDIIKKYI